MIGRAALRIVALAGAAVTPCQSTASWAGEIPWKIDEPAAERLASEAYFGSDADVDAFNYSDRMGLPFFVFDGLNESRPNGSFGFFAVNPWTGDVWALWGCYKLMTPALHESLGKIRRRFTHNELKHYARLSRLKPDCIVED